MFKFYSVHSYLKLQITATISSIPDHIRWTDEHPIKCLILWVVEVACCSYSTLKGVWQRSYFVCTSNEYIFSSHINTIPNTGAELRSKRQTELETWGMVPKAGPDTGTARNQRPVVAPLTRQEQGSSSERALSCSPAQRAWEPRRVPGKEEFE